MLRIGFDGRTLVSPAAGVRRYATELFGALAAHADLQIVAVGAPDRAQLPPGVIRAGGGLSLPTNVGWMVTGLPHAAVRAGLDLFHAPSYTAPAGGPRPLVLTIHDVSYERHPEWYPYRRDWIRRAFYRWSARTANLVVTDSEFSKREILNAYQLSQDAVRVVPLAAAAVFRPGPRLSLPDGSLGRYLLHVGDVHTRRNLGVVVRAIAQLRERREYDDVTLVLAGVDRGGLEELKALSSSATGRIPVLTTFPPTADETLLALYRSARALVYPSRYEGFGLPVLEAMACGTPVVAARSSAIPEVTGNAAVLLEPDDQSGWNDAIKRILDDEQSAMELRRLGLQRASEFSWTRTAAETARIYRTLLEK